MSYYGGKGSHQCQIDCTNHDEVINKLQIKSKDLYYFWRNYEWLYNKYYSQNRQEDKHATVSQDLEDEVTRLQSENKKLRMENQSLKRKLLAHDSTSSIEQEYQREHDRLTAKGREFQGIIDKLTQENKSLQNKNRRLQIDAEDTQHEHNRDIKRQETTIIGLQKTIDELRGSLNHRGEQGQHLQVIHDKHKRELQSMKLMVSTLQKQVQSIIRQEFDNTRFELLEKFPALFESYSRGNIGSIIIEYEDTE